MNRRDVVEGLLLTGVAAGTVLGPRGFGLGTAPTAARAPGLRILVFDTRYAAARDFASQLAGSGVIAQGIDGDVTALWHQLLASHWHRTAVVMQGMTTPPSFYCLEQLVADRFWRTTARVADGELIKWSLQPRISLS